jgi:hypothetical protein
LSQRPTEDQRAHEVPEEQEPPDPAQLQQSLAVSVLQQRHHRNQSVLGKQLASRHDHEDEPEWIRGRLGRFPKRWRDQLGGERTRQKAETDHEPGGQCRPEERGRGPLDLLLRRLENVVMDLDGAQPGT